MSLGGVLWVVFTLWLVAFAAVMGGLIGQLLWRARARPRRGRIVLNEATPWHVPVRFVRDRHDRGAFRVVYDRPGWRRRPMEAELRPGEQLVVDKARHGHRISVKFSSRH